MGWMSLYTWQFSSHFGILVSISLEELSSVFQYKQYMFLLEEMRKYLLFKFAFLTL